MRHEHTDLKVLWVTRHAAFAGGAERYVHEAAGALRHLGSRHTLVYEVDGAMDPRFLAPFDGAFPMVRLSEQVRLVRPDVIYVHQANADAVAELVSTGVPVVRFIHDHALLCPREHKFSPWTGQTCTRAPGAHCLACTGGLIRRGGRVSVTRPRGLAAEVSRQAGVAAWVVASEYLQAHASECGIPGDRIHNVPLFTEGAEQIGTPEEGHILYAGALNRGKGVDLLVRAMADLPNHLRLTVIGDGPARDRLQAQARRLGVHGRVYFAGSLPRWEVGARMERADVVAVPSRTPETFSLVGLEAASRGVPVVAADVGGIRAWLRDGVNGLLVKPNDAHALAAGLQRVLGDRTLRDDLGREGRRTWLSGFLPSHHASALMDVFTHVLGRTAREVA